MENLEEAKSSATREFSVRVLNEALNKEEKIARSVNFSGISLLRNSSLRFGSKDIELGAKDDSGAYQTLAEAPIESIQRVRIKKDEITPLRQVIKPALNGAFIGVVMSLIRYCSVKDNMAVSIENYVWISIIIILFCSILFILISIKKISWTKLSTLSFESNNDTLFNIALETKKIDELIDILNNKNITVDF